MKKRTKLTAAALSGTAAAALGGMYYGYWEAFKADPKRTDDIMDMPGGELYAPYRERVTENIDRLLAEPFERVSIHSHDGLRLRGRYYENQPGQPLFIFFHGYRSTAERDGSGGFQICKKHGWNVLQVDQRGHGESEGKTVTFGLRERYDCLEWIRWAVRRFGEETPIFLVGVSMGASTVLMAAGEPLPSNVVGVLADCGYTSARAIIVKVCRQLHLPAWLLYPAIRFGAMVFAGLDLEENSPIEAVKRIRVPVIFAHGAGDNLVPSYMSEENYAVCTAPKSLFITPGAGHGLCYFVAGEGYIQALRSFWTEQGIYGEIGVQ